MIIFFLSLRNLFLQRKRYTMIGIAVLVGFALITVISGIAYGAMETVKAKAARYFAGHVSVTGYFSGGPRIVDPDALIEELRSADLGLRTVARRTIYYKTDASLFYNGETVRQRRLVGIDFEAERSELANLAFSSGGIDVMLGGDGADGILISASAAKILGARIGDDVNLYLTTDAGQYNTAMLIVRGIFTETSLFGYVAYMRNDDLNRLLLRSPEAATDVALYAGSNVDSNELAAAVQLCLSDRYTVFPRMNTKNDLNAELAKGKPGEHLAVLSLDAHLAQIKSLLDAFLAITYFILVVFVLIIMVGVLNTYRVIVYERTKEIGTMRALGMGKWSVLGLFMLEAFGLAILTSTVGLVVGIVMLEGIKIIDLSFVPAAGMYTERGHLAYYLEYRIVWLNFTIMILGILSAAIGPARKAAAIHPADAMRYNS